MALTLFMITRQDVKPKQWYREARRFVIAAPDEKKARRIAAKHIVLNSCCTRDSVYICQAIETRRKWRREATSEVVGKAADNVSAGIMIVDHTGE